MCDKRTGMEPETVLLVTTIVDTGKSIDFYTFIYLFKVGYYPLLALACTCCLIILSLCIVFDHTLSLSFDLINLT